jgi:hypothetical protein
MSLVLQTSAAWVEYYEANARQEPELPWERGAELTDRERELIGPSLAEFQLGESSEGANLKARAAAHAAKHGEPAYAEAMLLFIGEEHNHSRLLGRYLNLAGVPLQSTCWADSVFRSLRRIAGLEAAICVLLVAETIALSYYAAVRVATGALLLRRICAKLLRDEVQHVRFHAERLAHVRRPRGAWRNALAVAMHKLLFGGTLLVVWWGHGTVYRAAGASFRMFWRRAWRDFRNVLRAMDPARYAGTTSAETREAHLVSITAS